MNTLQAGAISLYLEGLMILTFDRKTQTLEAAPLSRAGHRLQGIIHQRPRNNGVGNWTFVNYNPFETSNQHNKGSIFIETAGNPLPNNVAVASTSALINDEVWQTFHNIPNLEQDIIGDRVQLNHEMLRPRLQISVGEFFSVPEPMHPDRDLAVLRETLLVEKDALASLRATATSQLSLPIIRTYLEPATINLGFKAYTAAAHLSLNEGHSFVCQLNDGEGAHEVLRIDYDPTREIRMAIVNFPEQSQHTSVDPYDDPIHSFHSLHFYEALQLNPTRKLVLSDEGKRKAYVNKEPMEFMTIETGGSNPCCPLGTILINQ